MRILTTVLLAGIVVWAAQTMSLSTIISAAQASNDTTIVTGTVTDAQGAAAAGRPVRLWRVYEDGSGIGVQREPTAVTDATGRYALTGVPRGTYLVESLAEPTPQ